MTVKHLVTDIWDGRRNVGKTVDGPALEDICSAVEMLDGKRADGLTIETGEMQYLAIGGGKDGQYVVSIVNDTESWLLVNPSCSEHKDVTIKVGGQSIPYPSDLIVPRNIVNEAVNYYSLHARPCPSLEWRYEAKS